MPNGVRDGYCSFCHNYTGVHPRVEEDYDFFHGQYCDPCYDWIEVDEEHWRLFRLLQMANNRLTHPLAALIEHDDIGAAIASFARG